MKIYDFDFTLKASQTPPFQQRLEGLYAKHFEESSLFYEPSLGSIGHYRTIEHYKHVRRFSSLDEMIKTHQAETNEIYEAFENWEESERKKKREVEEDEIRRLQLMKLKNDIMDHTFAPDREVAKEILEQQKNIEELKPVPDYSDTSRNKKVDLDLDALANEPDPKDLGNEIGKILDRATVPLASVPDLSSLVRDVGKVDRAGLDTSVLDDVINIKSKKLKVQKKMAKEFKRSDKVSTFKLAQAVEPALSRYTFNSGKPGYKLKVKTAIRTLNKHLSKSNLRVKFSSDECRLVGD